MRNLLRSFLTRTICFEIRLYRSILAVIFSAGFLLSCGSQDLSPPLPSDPADHGRHPSAGQPIDDSPPSEEPSEPPPVEEPISTTPEIVDPNPESTSPGVTTCDGCPLIDISSFDITTPETHREFGGTVMNATGNGKYFMITPSGAVISGVVPTTSGGNYSVDLPLFCGQQTLKLIWENSFGSTIVNININRVDCINADIRLTLSWDDQADDLDIHFIEPGGEFGSSTSDCFFSTCIDKILDWGVIGDNSDNPLLDVDNTRVYGPENLVLSKPVSGIYKIMVEHYGDGEAINEGKVILNVKGQTVVAPFQNLPSRWVVNIGTISWPGGEITLNGAMTDCSATPSGTCEVR